MKAIDLKVGDRIRFPREVTERDIKRGLADYDVTQTGALIVLAGVGTRGVMHVTHDELNADEWIRVHEGSP